MRTRRRSLSDVVGHVMVAGALIVVLGPLLWVLRVALRPNEEFIGAPGEFGSRWTLDNFVVAWTAGGMKDAIIHSTVSAAVGSIVAVFLACASGFALSRTKFRGWQIVIGLVTLTMFLPAAALLIPLFELMIQLAMLDSLVWLGVVYGVLFSAWATQFMRSYFSQLPSELFEAAQVDGAGPVRQFLHVALPLALPAIATAFILNCFLMWSELLLALILLPGGGQSTVAVAIAQFSSQFRTGGPLTAAAMLLGTLPVFALFLVGQRWLQAGALSGATKD